MHTIKPIDREAVIAAAKMGPVVTAENASIVGGLGSAVAEVMAEAGIATKFERSSASATATAALSASSRTSARGWK